LRDVAARAGVSPALASFVVTGNRSVGEESRRRVLDAIEALGYTPNLAARGLRVQRTGQVSLLVPRLSNVVYSLTASGVERELARAGLLTVVSSTRTDEDESLSPRVFRALGSGRVDGAIVLPYAEDVPHIARLLVAGTPVVFLSHAVPLPPGTPFPDLVSIDTEAAVYDATRHLLDLGHRRIGFISLRRASLAGPPRLRGYERAYGELGLDAPTECLVLGAGRLEDGFAGTTRLLALRPPVTALVVAFTMGTPGALQAIGQAGVRVPDDLSFVGFTHEGFLSWPAGVITAVRYPAVEVGRTAARLLLGRIKETARPEPRHITLRPALVLGGSTGSRT
jgi:DNA-binding LacI/PurR family transcriptional regulator